MPNHDRPRDPAKPLFRIGRCLFDGMFRVGGWRVTEAERIPPHGPLLIISNHISNIDPPVVASAIRRPVHFLANRILFEIPLLGRVLPFVHAFPVRQDAPDRPALRTAIGLLRRGNCVLVFPEGRTNPVPSELLPFAPGAAFLAHRARCPVLLVVIRGTDRFMPYGTCLPRFRPITVHIADALPPAAWAHLDVTALTVYFEERMRRLVQKDKW